MQLKIVSLKDIPKKVENTPVSDLFNLYNICISMQELCKKEKGVGLSALQVGIPWHLFVMQIEKGPTFRYFIDCVYKPLSVSKMPSMEGCLSLKDKKGRLRYFVVDRYPKIRIVGKELTADKEPIIKDVDEVVSGFDAVIVQHEVDHGFGVLINQIGEEINVKQ